MAGYSKEQNDLRLNIAQTEELYQVAKALASRERIRILEKLADGYHSIGELAKLLDCPFSSTAFHVRVLEDAGLVSSETRPGVHGALKFATRRISSLALNMHLPMRLQNLQLVDLQLPIGAYSRVDSVRPTCGLTSEHAPIGEYDNVCSFYLPERLSAQLIWFREGFVEYDFSFLAMNSIRIERIELSFEACSEAPLYRDPWPSDITVSVNGVTLGMWTCPCDCGGRPGVLNPGWWSATSTQYGFLKTWAVDHQGSYLENTPISDVSLEELDIAARDKITVRIGVSPDAKNKGGMNLFGERFGDYNQGVRLRVHYSVQ